MATSIKDLRAEVQVIARELRRPNLPAEQREAKKDRLDVLKLRLTQAMAREREREREEERRLQARRDSWLERGESRRLRRSF